MRKKAAKPKGKLSRAELQMVAETLRLHLRDYSDQPWLTVVPHDSGEKLVAGIERFLAGEFATLDEAVVEKTRKARRDAGDGKWFEIAYQAYQLKYPLVRNGKVLAVGKGKTWAQILDLLDLELTEAKISAIVESYQERIVERLANETVQALNERGGVSPPIRKNRG